MLTTTTTCVQVYLLKHVNPKPEPLQITECLVSNEVESADADAERLSVFINAAAVK